MTICLMENITKFRKTSRTRLGLFRSKWMPKRLDHIESKVFYSCRLLANRWSIFVSMDSDDHTIMCMSWVRKKGREARHKSETRHTGQGSDQLTFRGGGGGGWHFVHRNNCFSIFQGLIIVSVSSRAYIFCLAISAKTAKMNYCYVLPVLMFLW